ncbi:MAG TPA: TetR/AcrR family transcriptional regulator, partial [Bacteroidales bacterium]|nr:TetR/AcrR family transcriptional regulator [Bacteroidales bacterium]
MKNVSQKYLDIMSYGKALFWKYGMKRVTVEEICEEANVSKMTFYKYFGNKDKLALEIIRSLLENTLKEFLVVMESDIPFKKKVEATVKMKMEQTGTISKEFLSDLYTGDY